MAYWSWDEGKQDWNTGDEDQEDSPDQDADNGPSDTQVNMGGPNAPFKWGKESEVYGKSHTPAFSKNHVLMTGPDGQLHFVRLGAQLSRAQTDLQKRERVKTALNQMASSYSVGE